MMNASDGVFVLLTFLPIILYLALIVFGIYFVVRVIKFMNVKTKLDQERNEKISELIKVIDQRKRSE
ncbi:hypothetical protein [Desertibacillus haloalkaliphilus]|uniref:hypothetical protein n=1 Tax=Desertibacillus haloalkaliphilus TaxID=1328930 RepID=UPI001C258447|nr:hypothetical protein [Desertibacillus haloalkaliphilus]MBU8906140.1 hypothetical protein [Desertibacillus haloalkaliphilus]